MTLLVYYQMLILAVVTLAFWLFGGASSGVSALLGGLCYLLPTLAAVLVLNFFQTAKTWLPASFFWGESLKIMLSIMLMAVVAFAYSALQWLPFLVGLIMVSHIVFFVYWKIKHHGK